MATEITFRRGSNDPTSGSGITLAEPVFNTTNHTFHIGLGYGVTAEWVGAPISGLSADIAAGITYKIPTAAAVKNYVTGTSITNYVSSFNGLTGAVTGVTVGGANVFTALNSFNAGICASGITLSSGIITAPGAGLYLTSSNTKNAKVNLLSGPSSSQVELDAITVRVRNTTDGALPTFELYEATDVYSAKMQYTSSATNDATITFPAFTGTVALTDRVVTSVNGQTGAVTIASATNVVTSFNGLTGTVQGVSAAVAGTGISVSGATGAVTITNIGVQSFNGATGAVTGASLGANTFTALNTFNAGITTSYIYASTGSTFGGTLKVVGGATFDGRVYVGGDLYSYGSFNSNGDATFDRTVVVSGGATFAATANFTNGLTSAGDIRFRGTATKNIRSTQAPIVITGITSGVSTSYNSITVPVDNTALALGSASGNVTIVNNNSTAAVPGLRILTDDQDFIGQFGTVIKPGTYATAERTQTLQDASGTIALTSQLMGAINGSTAATTAVTSFNGRTGAVQGVSAAAAGDGIAVSGATGAVTITNTGVTRAVAGTGISVSGATGSVTITNIGVQSFNGNTGAVTGASLGANTFTGLNTFSAGITTAYIYASNGSTFGGTLQVNGAATFSGTVNGSTATFNRLLTASGGISAAGGMTLDGGTVWHSLNDGATSGLDAGLVHGVCGARFLENLQTGLMYGGLISINAGNTAQVDITAGAGIIVSPGASLTAYPIPTVTPVTWAAKTGVTLSGITSSDETWLTIDSSGSLIQTNVAFTDAQYASQIPLGAALHLSRSYIQLVKSYPHVSYGQADQVDPFIRAFGNLKLSGHEISANGANLNVNRSAGKAYALGRNYKNDPNNPNIVTDTSAAPATSVYHFYRNGSGGFTTTINGAIVPGSLDDGTGTLGTVTPAKFTIQRIFYLPDQPTLIGVYYGRQEYNSIVDAQANIPYEAFTESESTTSQGIFCGWLIVRGNATALNDTATAKFVNAGLFRNTSNIGGGGLAIASIDDLSDVTTTTPSNNQVLRWNSGTSQWVNSDVSSLAVSSFNGATGAITGVSSVNGQTGAVTIASSTNVVTSFNGLTGTVQGVSAAVAGTGISVSGATGSVTITNTGVQTFNGLTGAVTGVTVGGANTFTALNSFNAGISASALTVSGGVTFSSNVYLGDAATGVTAESNDYVMMMGGTGSAAFKSGFYQTYKLLAGSTSGVVCVTPAFNSNTTKGSSTLEITISYTRIIAGPSPQTPITHKFVMPLLFSYDDTLYLYDYTESITRSDPSYTPLTFTFVAESNRLKISTTTTADSKFTSGWGFRTTVQVH